MSKWWATDEQLPPFVDEYVDTDYAKRVCKIGQGIACCRYLTMSAEGWSCERNEPHMRAQIDGRVLAGLYTAQGINCDGRKTRNEHDQEH